MGLRTPLSYRISRIGFGDSPTSPKVGVKNIGLSGPPEHVDPMDAVFVILLDSFWPCISYVPLDWTSFPPGRNLTATFGLPFVGPQGLWS